MRLFVSIDVPEAIGLRLNSWLPEDIGIRKTPINQLHLTLLFLGDVQQEKIAGIVQKLNDIRFKPFQMVIADAGAFPEQKKPKIIWAGIEKNPALTMLHQKIIEQLRPFIKTGYGYTFVPHITLGRVREPGIGFPAVQLREDESLNVDVRQFTLKQSVLTAAGSEHTMLYSFTSTS